MKQCNILWPTPKSTPRLPLHCEINHSGCLVCPSLFTFLEFAHMAIVTSQRAVQDLWYGSRILCAFSLCDFLSSTICSDLRCTAWQSRSQLAEKIEQQRNWRCRALWSRQCGQSDWITRETTETSSATWRFTALPHPVCFSCKTAGLCAHTNWREKLFREIKTPKQKAKGNGALEASAKRLQ